MQLTLRKDYTRIGGEAFFLKLHKACSVDFFEYQAILIALVRANSLRSTCALCSCFTDFRVLLTHPKALCVQRENEDYGHFIQGICQLLQAMLVGKFLLLTESIDFFYLGNEQKVTSCRSIHLSILGWRRRVFETEIAELKKRRRKGQRVINILKAAWAKPGPQKHLDLLQAGRWREHY